MVGNEEQSGDYTRGKPVRILIDQQISQFRVQNRSETTSMKHGVVGILLLVATRLAE